MFVWWIFKLLSVFEKDHSNELIEVLVSALENEENNSGGRSGYNYLAQTMKSIAKEFPEAEEQIYGVAHKLKEKFPRRPAMQEVLNKLLSAKI